MGRLGVWGAAAPVRPEGCTRAPSTITIEALQTSAQRVERRIAPGRVRKARHRTARQAVHRLLVERLLAIASFLLTLRPSCTAMRCGACLARLRLAVLIPQAAKVSSTDWQVIAPPAPPVPPEPPVEEPEEELLPAAPVAVEETTLALPELEGAEVSEVTAEAVCTEDEPCVDIAPPAPAEPEESSFPHPQTRSRASATPPTRAIRLERLSTFIEVLESQKGGSPS